MYQIELANKIVKGRAVGNLYVVTRRPIGMSGIIAKFDTREEAQAWIDEQGSKAARDAAARARGSVSDAVRHFGFF